MLNFSSISQDSRVSALAIGKFDGMHLAHQEILRALGDSGAALVIKMPHNLAGVLLPLHLRPQYTHTPMFFVDFAEICDLSGAEFLLFLREKLPNLATIVVGEDFAFGKNRAWKARDIPNLLPQPSPNLAPNSATQSPLLRVKIIPEIYKNALPVHSSEIKRLILGGEMEAAAGLLGRFYAVCGGVVKGQGLGQKSLFPTINITAGDYILPKDGVYASLAVFGEEDLGGNLGESGGESSRESSLVSWSGEGVESSESLGESCESGESSGERDCTKIRPAPNLQKIHPAKIRPAVALPAITFLGTRFSTDFGFSLETHILGCDLKTPPKTLEIRFLRRLRGNKRFENLADLKAQIAADIIAANAAHSEIRQDSTGLSNGLSRGRL